MFKKVIAVMLIISLSGVSLFGCSTLKTGKKLNGQMLTATNDKPVAHVYGNTWGIYLFPWIPIMTGNTDNPGNMALFNDTVTIEDTVDMVTKKSSQMGANKTTDLQSSYTSFWIPFVPIPPFFLFWYKNVDVSGNAVK
jgi:hypothetical protein